MGGQFGLLNSSSQHVQQGCCLDSVPHLSSSLRLLGNTMTSWWLQCDFFVTILWLQCDLLPLATCQELYDKAPSRDIDSQGLPAPKANLLLGRAMCKAFTQWCPRLSFRPFCRSPACPRRLTFTSERLKVNYGTLPIRHRHNSWSHLQLGGGFGQLSQRRQIVFDQLTEAHALDSIIDNKPCILHRSFWRSEVLKSSESRYFDQNNCFFYRMPMLIHHSLANRT